MIVRDRQMFSREDAWNVEVAIWRLHKVKGKENILAN